MNCGTDPMMTIAHGYDYGSSLPLGDDEERSIEID